MASPFRAGTATRRTAACTGCHAARSVLGRTSAITAYTLPRPITPPPGSCTVGRNPDRPHPRQRCRTLLRRPYRPRHRLHQRPAHRRVRARGPAVLYAHGPAGIGKSALLHRFAALARAEHRHVVEIDAARVASAPALIDQIRETATRSGTVLVVDGIDHLDTVSDALPGGLLSVTARDGVTVVAGRRAPRLA
jgi:hypothetical protein